MTDQWTPRTDRLRDVTVVIVAETPQGAPTDHSALQSDVLEAEEAVMSLVRAIRAEGGNVALRADRPLALLAAVVAGEYAKPPLDDREERGETPHLSIVTRPAVDDADTQLELLASFGLVSLATDIGSAVFFEQISNPAAMVCVGTGSLEDLEMFRGITNGRAPVFVMAATGGGARQLARGEGQRRFEIIDDVVAREAPLPEESNDRPGGHREDAPLPPLTLSAQIIVERLLPRGQERRG